MRLPSLSLIVLAVCVTSASAQTPQGTDGKASTPSAAPSATNRVFRALRIGRR